MGNGMGNDSNDGVGNGSGDGANVGDGASNGADSIASTYRGTDPPYQASDPPSEWATDYVVRAVEYGVVPSNLRNDFTGEITRSDYCTVLALVLLQKDFKSYTEYKLPEDPPFTDSGDPDVWWLNSMEVVSGVGDNQFNPDGSITRQEAAVLLRRAAVKLGVDDVGTNTEFVDQGQVADWAVEGLNFVVANGIMSGKGDNIFDPLGSYTREEAYITMVRLFDLIPQKVSISEYMAEHPDLFKEPAPGDTSASASGGSSSTSGASASQGSGSSSTSNGSSSTSNGSSSTSGGATSSGSGSASSSKGAGSTSGSNDSYTPIVYNGLTYNITGIELRDRYHNETVPEDMIVFVVIFDITGRQITSETVNKFWKETKLQDTKGNSYSSRVNTLFEDEKRAEFYYIILKSTEMSGIKLTWPDGFRTLQ